MRVGAIDVGIKNLAICIVEDDKIVDWNVINLLDEDETNHKCCVCNKYKSINKNDNGTYCKRHTPENYTKIIKPKVSYDPLTYGRRMFHELDKKKELYNTCVHITIENQPSLRNPKIKAVASFIFAWFIYCCSNTVVSHISANNKLKVYKGNDIPTPNVKSKYTQRKQLGILHTRKLLMNEPESLSFLDNHPTKIDDLCDSFLLAKYKQNELLNKEKKMKKTIK